jgi:hypothetical protein
MLRKISFYLQNYPASFIKRWFPYHQSKTNNNSRDLNVLFALKNISNHFFMRQLIYKNLFINIYQLDSLENPVGEMAKFIEMYCENLLVKGDCSENELYIDFSDRKSYLLREYKEITYNNFDNNWFNFVTYEHGYYEKLNTLFCDLPYSYVWSTYFSENKDEALVLDDFFIKKYPILSKYMTFTQKMDKEKKYKVVFWDGGTYNKLHFSEVFDRVDDNGICVSTKAVFYVGSSTIGWYDLKTSTTGFIKS